MTTPKKILLIAGPASHGPGDHEHNAGCILLAKCLNESVPGLKATAVSGWPTDPKAFDGYDAFAIYSDGGGGHLIVPHLEQAKALAKKGVGTAFIHYAVEVEKGPAGDAFLEFTGGYFEGHWSVNPFWDAEFKSFPKHAVTRGVRPFTMNDEWYYHMRFRPNMEGVTPLLSAIPPASTLDRPDGYHSGNPHVRKTIGQPQHLGWVRERADKGRGFGFTGGHRHTGWAQDDFRKFVLNGLAWVAGVEIPETGIVSKTPTADELKLNLDKK